MKKMGLVISLGIQSLMAWEPIANRFLLHTLLQRNKLIFCAQINAVRYIYPRAQGALSKEGPDFSEPFRVLISIFGLPRVF